MIGPIAFVDLLNGVGYVRYTLMDPPHYANTLPTLPVDGTTQIRPRLLAHA